MRIPRRPSRRRRGRSFAFAVCPRPGPVLSLRDRRGECVGQAPDRSTRLRRRGGSGRFDQAAPLRSGGQQARCPAKDGEDEPDREPGRDPAQDVRSAAADRVGLLRVVDRADEPVADRALGVPARRAVLPAKRARSTRCRARARDPRATRGGCRRRRRPSRARSARALPERRSANATREARTGRPRPSRVATAAERDVGEHEGRRNGDCRRR